MTFEEFKETLCILLKKKCKIEKELSLYENDYSYMSDILMDELKSINIEISNFKEGKWSYMKLINETELKKEIKETCGL